MGEFVKREKIIETALVRQIREIGGLCYKLNSYSARGLPDRIVLYRGKVVFVECKSEVGKLGKAQENRIKELKAQGFDARVIRDLKGVIDLCDYLLTRKSQSTTLS